MIVGGPRYIQQVGAWDCHTIRYCVEPRFLFLVSSGHEEVVRELVGARADVDRKNDKGMTPLFVFRVSYVPMCYNDFGAHRHYAASKSRIEVSVCSSAPSSCTQPLLR